MKPSLKNIFLLPTLIAGLGFLLAGRVTAQTFTVLHSFTNGSDGANPYCGLVSSGNTLFGVAAGVGGSGTGPVFAVNTDGSGFTNLYSFTGGRGGSGPEGGLLLSGNTLYGTTYLGGVGFPGNGIVYAVNTDGTGFTNLHTFTATSFLTGTNGDGANSRAVLVLSGNTLYGTASAGGSSGSGTVFAVNTDGTGFTNLHSFTLPQTDSFLGTHTNYDGASPSAGLVLSGNTLYGTVENCGGSGNGTVFAISTDGTGFTNLHSFTALVSGTNSDGANPSCNLILSGNTLYGTANFGGSFAGGTVFAVNTDGTGFTNLYNFTGGSDGAQPWAGLTLSGGTLYGTTHSGGSSSNGTVFVISTNGTGFTSLYSFTGGSDGANPNDQLVVSGNALYGTARNGGAGYGTVFSLFILPQLTITPSGANVVLTWPTNYAGFTFQSTTNLGSSAVWSTNSPAPVVVNGQNTMTNPISGPQMFFRLSQ